LVPKQAHEAQEDATGRRRQSAAVRRAEELAPREQMETRDAEQRVGKRDAPLQRSWR